MFSLCAREWRIGQTLSRELFIRYESIVIYVRKVHARRNAQNAKEMREQMSTKSNDDGKGKIPTAEDFVEKFTEKTSEQMKSSLIIAAKFAQMVYGKKCDQSIAGTWTQVSRVPSSTTTVSDEDEKRTDSLCPLLSGLGAPAFVCGIVDRLTTTLTISCTDDYTLRVVDKTPLTKENVTETGLRGIGKEETRCKTKGGRKEYMLSGDVKMDGTNQFACRLISRGDGWWTISERSLTDESGKYLRERNILRAPGKKDVVVDRYFERSK